MMKKSAIFLGLAAIAVMGFLFFNYEKSIEKDVLYLKNGKTIVSDETWEGGHLVYYTEDEISLFIEKKKVASIAYGAIQSTVTGQELTSRWLSAGREKIINLVNNSDNRMEEARKWFTAFGNRASSWMLFIIALPAYLIIIRGLKRRKRAAGKKSQLTRDAPARKAVLPAKGQKVQAFSGTMRVAHFFLNLFRLQIDAPEEADSEVIPIGEKVMNGTQVYQLQIKHDGEWVSRRMSIGPLGEESGSKSDCFYVIYDVHMVIKIPSTPITDFHRYIENIGREGRIVDKLAPKECIIPKISVILQRVYEYPGAGKLTPEKLEEGYIRLLGNRKDLQKYLQIGNTFVFFMDLSKYYFLGHIVKDLHDISHKMVTEITTHPGIIWDAQAFTGRYGAASGAACFNIQNLYTACETEIRNELAQSESPAAIQPYQLKGWFLCHLAGKQIAADKEKLDETLAERLNTLFGQHLEHHAGAVKKYRSLIRKQIREKNIIQSRGVVESITINVLELLAWLGTKKIAMRDLKPDNLIVAGDPANYPRFLKTAADFNIGLIDVETAVDFETPDGKKIPQPQLSGTPNYATPSHLLKNDTLQLVFDDLPGILHIQDWQASLAIIYKITTGETLFKRTARLLPGILKKIKKIPSDPAGAAKTVKMVSQAFWQSAQSEFYAKTDAKELQLNDSVIELTAPIKQMFKDKAVKMKQMLTDEAAKCIDVQKIFATDKNRRQLLAASAVEIGRLRAKWTHRPDLSQGESEKAKEVAALLGMVEQLKRHADEMGRMAEVCDQTDARLNLNELLSFIFIIILNSMYKIEWNTPDENPLPSNKTITDRAA